MEGFLSALSELNEPTYWLALFAAIGLGTVVGFLPGVGATLVTAIMVPFVVLTIEDPAIGIVMLAMVAALNNTLDSIPAVLVGLPGSETQVTYLEGHQLARRGRAAHTLGAIYSVSAMGGVLGAIALALVVPVIKPFILEFGYAEIAMVALFGIAMVALLSRGGMLKGLTAGLFGILLGTVGLDPVTGTARFTMDVTQLWEGLPIATTILGIFALPEIWDLTASRQSVAPKDSRVSIREVLNGAWYGLTRWKMVIRQSLFGTFMGAIPGIGGSVIDWLSYAFGISLSRKKDRGTFGKGSLDGVLFAESANNSKAGGQALPTLTLGVPGSTSWAIIVVALLAYGISPGPSMVDQHADIVMLMVITLAIGNVIVTVMGLLATNWLARITRIPYAAIGFVIMPVAFLAAFMELNAWLAIFIILVLGVAGLLMKRYGWPRPPLILGFILGPIVEENLQSALSIHGPIGLLTRPIAIVLFILVVVTVIVLSRLTSRSAAVAAGTFETIAEADTSTDTGTERPTDEAPPLDDLRGEPDESEPTTGLSRRGPCLKRRLLREENVGPVLALAAAIPFALASFSYPERAAVLPMSAAFAILVLALAQLTKQVLGTGSRDAQIMDLGMRSSGMEGAVRAGLTMAATVTLFLLIGGLVSLKYAAITLAAVGPMLLLSGRLRWIAGAISGCVVAIFAILVMERFVGVVWPDPVLWNWLQDAIF